MSEYSTARHALLAAIGIVVAIALLDPTGVDLWFARLLFDADRQQWILSGSNPVLRLLFYNGPKLLLILGLFACLIGLLFVRWLPYRPAYARGLRIVMLSLILVPASVSALKPTTNVACPRALVEFGGQAPYVGVLHTAAAPRSAVPGSTVPGPTAHQPCFPAAHASGGFALFGLLFLFASRRGRRRAIALGLAAGWTMGIYKMAIGDHFLSHTVVSMLLAWLIVNLIVMADDWLQSRVLQALSPAVNS